MQNQIGISRKPQMIQSIPKPTAEQELSHQQFWLCVLVLYHRHTTMTLLFGQFVHLFVHFTISYIL